MAAERKVLLIVGGGIAAYKALELIRLLRKADIGVRAILTSAGAEFVTPLSIAALTGHPVHQALFSPDDETAMGHIELSRWADLVVVAPATADLLARAFCALSMRCFAMSPIDAVSALCTTAATTAFSTAIARPTFTS